jgi:hypothetical protein
VVVVAEEVSSKARDGKPLLSRAEKKGSEPLDSRKGSGPFPCLQ